MCFTTTKAPIEKTAERPITVIKIRKKVVGKEENKDTFVTGDLGFTYNLDTLQDLITLEPKRSPRPYYLEWYLDKGYCSYQFDNLDYIKAWAERNGFVVGRFEIPAGCKYYESRDSIAVVKLSWATRGCMLSLPPKELISENLIFRGYL